MTESHHNFSCSRCAKSFQCIACFTETCSKQADKCASTVREQQAYQKNYVGGLDCPPRNSVLPPGAIYIQSFYGSDYDDEIFSFAFHDKESIAKLYPWIDREKSSPICDFCIVDLLRQREIYICKTEGDIAGHYPTYCDVCEKLFDNMPDTKINNSYTSVNYGIGCSIAVIRDFKDESKWQFADCRFRPCHFLSLERLDGLEKCLKTFGRVCDDCFDKRLKTCGSVSKYDWQQYANR